MRMCAVCGLRRHNTKHPTTADNISVVSNKINECMTKTFENVTGKVFVREAMYSMFFNSFLATQKLNGNKLPRYTFHADAACDDLKIMLEYNGPYHHKSSETVRTINNILKRRWCRMHNYVQITVCPLIDLSTMHTYVRFRLFVDAYLYEASIAGYLPIRTAGILL